MNGSFTRLQTKTGVTWRGRFSYVDPVTGKRKHKRVSAPTKKECEALVRDELSKLDRGERLRDDTLTVATFLERWLASHEAHVRATTHRRYSGIVKNYLTRDLGAAKLTRLTALDLQRYYDRLLANGETPSQVAYIHTVLRTALTQATRWGLVDRNVASLAKAPSVPMTHFPTWTAPEVAAVLAVAETTPLAALWRLALLLGLRRGELLGLWWEDIDLDRATLAVRRTMQKGKTGWVVGPPKTAGSARSLALAPSCVAALRQHRDRQAFDRQRLGEAWQDTNFVFTNLTGGPLHVNSLAVQFARLISAAGVPTIRFHDLRHTYATISLAAGIHPKIVSETLGHTSVQITLDRYSHVLEGLGRNAADLLDATIAAAGNPPRVPSASPDQQIQEIS